LRSERGSMRGHDLIDGIIIRCVTLFMTRPRRSRTDDFLSRHACGKKTTRACPWMSPKCFPGSLFARRGEPDSVPQARSIDRSITATYRRSPSLCFTHGDKKLKY
jgi:hypothetical protein